jgi:plasmid replication initiation protein
MWICYNENILLLSIRIYRGVNEIMKDDLYTMFLKYDYDDLLNLFKQSNTKEKKDFYMALANIVLQREQRKVIGKE